MTRQELETALDAGKLFVPMSNGNYWRCRRNGRTQTWKRDANRFRIPFKMGMYGYGVITEHENDGFRIEGRDAELAGCFKVRA